MFVSIFNCLDMFFSLKCGYITTLMWLCNHISAKKIHGIVVIQPLFSVFVFWSNCLKYVFCRKCGCITTLMWLCDHMSFRRNTRTEMWLHKHISVCLYPYIIALNMLMWLCNRISAKTYFKQLDRDTNTHKCSYITTCCTSSRYDSRIRSYCKLSGNRFS